MLKKIISEIKNYKGIRRKNILKEVISFFPKTRNFGEDCAVIDYGKNAILFATDGIMETLMNKSPYWSGYSCVLANVNDIYAKGGIPIAMVDVLSFKDNKICKKVLSGINYAIKKFRVPIVGGHTHPDCSYNAIDIAIIGKAKKENVIYSDTAKNKDDIIFAYDLNGKIANFSEFAWDTTSFKNSEDVLKRLKAMNELAKKKLLSSAKDMSNPGTLGTLGMLLERSKKGAVVNLKKILCPKIDFIQWLKVYQSCGFVVSCEENKSKEVIKIYEKHCLSASVVGKVDNSNKLKITDGKETKVLFDFRKERITGING